MEGLNLFIGYLDDGIDDECLRQEFKRFGTIINAAVMKGRFHNGLNYGFVHFASLKDAEEAIRKMNGARIMSNCISVSVAKNQQAKYMKTQCRWKSSASVRSNSPDSSSYSSEYSKYTKSQSRRKSRTSVRGDSPDSSSYSSEYWKYAKPQSRRKSRTSVRGHSPDSSSYSSEYSKYTKALSRRKSRQSVRGDSSDSLERKTEEGRNLFVANLDHEVDDGVLLEAFESYGTVTGVEVIRDDDGLSKGYGFVNFSSTKEAATAMHRWNDPFVPQYCKSLKVKSARYWEVFEVPKRECIDGKVVIPLRASKNSQVSTENFTSSLEMKCLRGRHEIRGVKFSFQGPVNETSIIKSLFLSLTVWPKGFVHTEELQIKNRRKIYVPLSRKVFVSAGNNLCISAKAEGIQSYHFLQFDEKNAISPDSPFECSISSKPKDNKLYFISEIQFAPLKLRFASQTKFKR